MSEKSHFYEGWSAAAQQRHQMGIQIQMQAENRAKREIEEASFFATVVPVQDRTQRQTQQQHQSGGLLNLSAKEIADSHARQKAHIATLMNQATGLDETASETESPKTLSIATVDGQKKIGPVRILKAA